MNDQQRRNQALFPMSIVTQLTQLSARQIRYYEEHNLIKPQRNNGRQRLYSFNDVERLLQIKELIEQGLNIAGIKKVLKMREAGLELQVTTKNGVQQKELSDRELHRLVRQQMFSELAKPNQTSMIQGQLSRFLH
jgi:MerR family glutamine synthetase transcriptional repressor